MNKSVAMVTKTLSLYVWCTVVEAGAEEPHIFTELEMTLIRSDVLLGKGRYFRHGEARSTPSEVLCLEIDTS